MTKSPTTLALAADARARHATALDALRDAGRLVSTEVAAVLTGHSTEVPVTCAFSAPVPSMLHPDDDPLPSRYRVIFERWFGAHEERGTRMVEVAYSPETNLWTLTLDAFFRTPDPLGPHSKNNSAQGSHCDKRGYVNHTFPVEPGHLRHAS